SGPKASSTHALGTLGREERILLGDMPVRRSEEPGEDDDNAPFRRHPRMASAEEIARAQALFKSAKAFELAAGYPIAFDRHALLGGAWSSLRVEPGGGLRNESRVGSRRLRPHARVRSVASDAPRIRRHEAASRNTDVPSSHRGELRLTELGVASVGSTETERV